MFWLLSAIVLYGLAMLLIGVMLAAGIGHPMFRVCGHSLTLRLRHGRGISAVR
jgi:hypothetical protein